MSLRGRKPEAISIGGTGFQPVNLDDRQDAGPTEYEIGFLMDAGFQPSQLHEELRKPVRFGARELKL